MRKSFTGLGHPAAVVMPGVVVMPLTAPDRLRLYRRCFHELEEQLTILQDEGRESEARSLQAEVRLLEELIIVFTELNPVPANKQLLTPEVWMADAALEALDLSLVTDILMLSATSPWTVYIADRSQWLLCFVSTSVKRTTGWTSQELLGTAAWGACHPEDVTVVHHMLHLRDSEPSGGSVIYRRVRKDRSYVTVQATGRAIGTRWYAWVEQDILNFSPVTHQKEHPQANQNKGVARGPKLVFEGDTSVAVRPRRHSSPWAAAPEVPNPNWNPIGGGSRSDPPSLTAAALPQQKKGNGCSDSALDETITVKPIPAAREAGIAELLKLPSRLQEALPVPVILNTEAEQNGEFPAPTRSNNNGGGDRASKIGKGKAVAQETSRDLSSSSSNPRLDAALSILEAKELLQGKKVLLAEDDAVNRKVGQRLLRSLNCNVTVACNGQEALNVLRQVPESTNEQLATGAEELPPQFDLVLMDLQMPVMDGTHAVQLFRDWEELQEPPRKRMTIFALTSNVSDRDMVKCAQSGFDEFVSKPLTIEKLVERMKKINNDPVTNRVLDP